MEPESLEKLLFAATDCFRASDFASASILYREVLHHDPENPTALMMLGVLSQRAGQVESAIQFLEMARAIRPDNASIWLNNALALEQAGRLREAGEAAEIALLLDPLSPEALDTAGHFACLTGNAALAMERHSKALSVAPENALFLAHYGAALLGTGSLQEAYRAVTDSLAQDDSLAFAHHTMGLILRAAGHPVEAIASFQEAQKHAPHEPCSFIEEGKTHLLCGDYAKGWEKIELFAVPVSSGLPVWKGKRVRHLILLAEKELENTLHFLRYFSVPALCHAAHKLTLVIEEEHHAFLRENLPGLSLAQNREAAGQADAEIMLRLLPSRLTKGKEEKPPPPLVFHAPSTEGTLWRERLEKMPHPRIGLVWRRKRKDQSEGQPYLDPSLIEPLVEEFGAHLISLQSATPGLPFTASNLIPDLGAMAGLFSELDLLIAVDGPAAHLAGNMGLPVWLLTPYAPSWRWHYAREDSPLYPSFRLFRQEKPDDWEKVLTEIKKNLRLLLQGNREALVPPTGTLSLPKEHPQAIDLYAG